MSRFLQCSWMRGPRAEAPERTPKAEVRRSPYGAQDSKRKEFLHQQERRRRGLDLFGYFLGQAKKVTPGEGADSPFKNKHVTVFKIELRSLLNDKLLSSRRDLRPPEADQRQHPTTAYKTPPEAGRYSNKKAGVRAEYTRTHSTPALVPQAGVEPALALRRTGF